MENGIDRIMGVVVLYNTLIEESITLKSLSKSLAANHLSLDLMVYDNSEYSKLQTGSTFIFQQFNIHYYHDRLNSGLGKAYNLAAKIALEKHKNWIFLLDQDTNFPIESISEYLDALKGSLQYMLFTPLLKLSNNSILSPCKYYFKRGFALTSIATGKNSFKNRTLINSGMLINLDSFALCGGYNEAIKLDFSDVDFIERFKKNHSEFYLINLTCLQDFSNNRTEIADLNKRFINFCDGAFQCPKRNFSDKFQYLLVVFLRATTLTLRTKNFIFFKTFIKNYIRNQ
jgi:GT2 family glycosyltransferase